MPSNEKQKAAATGTDDTIVDNNNLLTGQLTGNSDFGLNPMSVIDTDKAQEKRGSKLDSEVDKPFQMPDLDTRKRLLSSPDNGSKSNERCRTRTCDPLIKSQLLYQLS